MKFQGKVSNWNDDKGFGFVEPNGGGERAFVHIKAFTGGSRRPVDGDLIIYELTADKNKRYRADKIKFARDSRKAKAPRKFQESNMFSTVFTLTFCVGLVVLVLINRLPAIVPAFYLVMSLIAFVAYAIDKSAAQNGRWRTQESTLHLFALAGGWPGALYARNKLRHKSNKAEFKAVYWVTVMLNSGALLWLLSEPGALLLNNLIPTILKG